MGDGKGLMTEVEVAMGVCTWIGVARALAAAQSWACCLAWRRERREWQNNLVKKVKVAVFGAAAAKATVTANRVATNITSSRIVWVFQAIGKIIQ